MSDHTETARVFLRIAAEHATEAPHAQPYFIHLARDYGLSWEAISEEIMLPVATCQRLYEQYIDRTRKEVAA